MINKLFVQKQFWDFFGGNKNNYDLANNWHINFCIYKY